VLAGSSPAGVSSSHLARTLDDRRERVDQQLALLEQGGWLALRFTGSADDQGGLSYAPTAATLQLIGGWPSADSTLAQRFMVAIDEVDERAEDDAEKTQLQEFKDAAGRIGESTLAAVLAKLAAGGLAQI
jgi:hypothetical protein